jgi:hypothetical protein
VGEKTMRAQKDERGDPFRRFGHEHLAGWQPHLEIHGLEHQVLCGELLVWMEHQPVQAFDGRQAILRHDAPWLPVFGLAPRLADVEVPGGDAAARSGFEEDLGDQAVAVAGQGAEQFRAGPLFHDHARDALRHHRVEELERLLAIGVGRQQFGPALAVHRRNSSLDRLQEGLDRQIFSAQRFGLRGRRPGGQQESEADNQQPSHNGH